MDSMTARTRTTLAGQIYTVEVNFDGTGLVRERKNGRPLAEITTMATSEIETASRALIDDLAGAAVKSPAPWARAKP